MTIQQWIGGAFLMVTLGIPSVYGAPVQTVDVDLHSTTGTIPKALESRMVASIQGAATYMYQGKEDFHIRDSLQTYEKATMDVVDRILYGYTVKTISMDVGETLHIHLALEPYGKVVQSLETTVNYGNISPYGRSLIDADLGNVKPRLEQMLLGASLDSLDWITPLVQKSVRSDLEGSLPEFTPQIDVVGGDTAKATVYLVPNGNSVSRTTVTIQSNTLPSVFFYTMRQYYEKKLRQLEGLPVSFVRRHQMMIEKEIQGELNKSRGVTQFGVTMIPTLEVGSETTLSIHVDSSKYILRGEGYLDMGRGVDSVGLRLYTGVHDGPHDWYVETEFLPNRLEWSFKPSYGYQFTKDTKIGYQYRLPNHHQYGIVQQTIGNRWNARYERDITAKTNEFALSYDVHEYLRLEYVWGDHDRWLRLIGRI